MRCLPWLVLLSLVMPARALAASWTVDRYGTGDFTTIQDAIDAASDGDTISVLPATYAEAIDFSGKDIAVTSTDGSVRTTIEPSASSSSCAVSFTSGESSAATLTGFTVKNTYNTAICIESSSPSLSELSVEDSGYYSWGDNGGGAYVADGAPTFEDVGFDDNYGYYGGHVYVEDSGAPEFVNCSFSGGWAYYGGAAFVADGTIAFTDSTIDGNFSYYGGAVYLGNETTGTFTDTDLTGNWGYYAHGAAIYAYEATVDLSGGSVSGNYASYWSSGYWGAIYAYNGSDRKSTRLNSSHSSVSRMPSSA